ncbi:hypothetical protein [Cyclobacterium jeungdonense]|uniref:Uncharacterized protein n=1 Tax=Cyclobacterium jeungdonense TaxID=708087 RepID=A0ABT8CCG1_9BACT|nr:hypothetical protein [Cyclobacterium jeungdonense]MDN3690488.1 hypothetical protein [Cyclobacterium jeungdonense]
MKRLLVTLGLSALGVIVFASLKVLSEHYLYGWGILFSAFVFIGTLIYWFILVNRKKQQS